MTYRQLLSRVNANHGQGVQYGHVHLIIHGDDDCDCVHDHYAGGLNVEVF